jgi:N-methylhydantoinase A
MRVGVDIGGTFTDFVTSDKGVLRVHKQLSTPQNPAEALLNGLNVLTRQKLSQVHQVAHGSTVATNAILERKGSRIALITTQGFRDVLFIGRQNRPDVYALHPSIPTPLVAREDCYEVPERLDFKGNVLQALDKSALTPLLIQLKKGAYDAIAVCLLYSFINPAHEQLIRDAIVERQMLQAWQIALSSDVLPEFREYERASTVALEAYVRPIMTRYIQHLRQQLPAKTSLSIMKSDGGVIQANRIQERAVQTALSGPAAGVMGAFHLAKLAGYERIITLDMGGTSTDVALCDGDIRYATHNQIDGLPLRARMLDIETIGAGGGSLARIDAGGALRVGPQSAGAMPGPVAYGRGGTQPTVTDANLLLGRLDPQHFLDGSMALDIEATQHTMQPLAEKIGRDIYATSQGITDIANTAIERAVRRVSVERGHDPRQFVLVAFGGAGPLHACAVAEKLDMTTVLIPRHPGVLCALGLLVSDVQVDHSRPILTRATRNTIAQIRAMQAELLSVGRDELRQEGIADKQMKFRITLDIRYSGQAYELNIPFEGDIIANFHQAHRLAYGHALEGRDIEIVTMRLQAIGFIEKPTFRPQALGTSDATSATIGTKNTPLGNNITLYQREKLTHGMQWRGESLVFQLDSTVYIPPNWQARVDAYENLILTHHA